MKLTKLSVVKLPAVARKLATPVRVMDFKGTWTKPVVGLAV